ncbi:P-loop NTPase fold protein [Pseudoalteromonas sp. SG43-4]|uniref:KAP family P-loop NTPase fold protein n=1 Tax=Pseudoalteromonas sp. SG43-4 TaxID=2760969 RepID=UPI0015FEF99B|nr:P-loop NTPase fold protein [Pseudoalteromonas sp. SG43-4]MBB1430672.1 NTPase KAP [Pseudoalteromonas sp. SG43-4]
MKNTNCKYPEWLEKYTFDNCKLNRKEYGEFLTNYIKGEHDGFVLNLNGAWGTGKTEFLRRLYTHLTNEGHPTIYIDAWESDFSEVPLSVVASELINQLSKINQNIGAEFDKVSEYLGKVLKGSFIGGAGLLAKHLTGDSAAGIEAAKALFEASPEDFISSVKSNHEEQVTAIKNIREELGLLAEVLEKNHGKNLPVIVLIDELDRCRPNYAIEMLEVIKHFFTTKNFVFVVATDTTQLQESIRSVYGSNFDSNTYLKRFFNREARLAEPDLEHYLKLQEIDSTLYSEKIVLYPNLTNNTENNIRQYIIWVAKAYELSLRDVDQTIDKLKACLRGALYAEQSSNKVQVINIFSLLLGIVEFDLKNTSFDERKNDKPCIDGGLYKYNILLDNHDENVFSELYELNMYNSVKHSIEFQNGWGENQKGLVYGTHINAKGKDYDHYKGIIKKVVNEIDSSFYNFNRQKDEVKIWLWPDYQKVIKLAGNLD